ncbi:myocardin-related transcription factor A-like [Astyanax mexicanus]|uniref:myocardin-related transcription factor A-like n=1 Tax=Astyanax mexicanus TaxID=7994 RepID=UPI0020CABE4E|nr:myocardin-related transcription factor A-like [Astyanax mexicanus]
MSIQSLSFFLFLSALKSPAAFHEQRRSLERAKTEDYLKRKIRNRPARSELVRMHILEETCAEASLQVKQIMLKRARLADDLNDKLSQRPGPMELIQKNIIPVPSSIRQVLIDAENSLCGEDSSDALSPDQPVSQDPLNQDSSLSSAPLSASPDPSVSDSSPAQAPPPPPPPPLPMTTGTDSQQKMTNGKPAAQQPMTGPSKGSKAAAERSRKQKDSKPKVKKLKYHQYIPPDQKVERETLPPLPALDSAYSKLLNQQQLYLQLQIISQQHHLNYPTILPAPPRPPGDQQASSTSGCSSTKKAPPTQPPSTNLSSRYDIIKFNIPPLPPNLEELKVAELKHQLKIRALPVSGTKNDLIERLRTFHEQNECTTPSSTTEGTSEPAASTTNTPQTSQPPPHLPQTVQSQTSTTILHQPGNSRVVVAALPFVATVGMCRPPPPSADHSQIVQFGSCSPCSPLSPSHSEHSLAGRSPDGHACNGDTVGETVSSPLTQLSLQHSPPTPPTVHIIDSPPPVARGPSLLPRPTAPPGDKDQMLQEKDQRIAELTRMLQQKQRQVERLRSQLHDQQTVACISLPPITVKEEPLDISMEEVEEIVQVEQVEPQQQNCLEEFILQQNQLNLQKPAQNRRKKKQTKQQPQPRQTNTQHSGTPPSSQLLVDCPKSNSTPSLVRNGNSNRFLLTQTNHSTNGRADMGTQNKVANRVHQQRLKSTPSKLPSQSAPSIEVQPKQQTICKQPLKKALKPEKHGSANHIKARSVSFCTPSNVQPFCSAVPSANSPVHCSVNQREEMCLGVGQHVLFTPPSPKPIPSTPTSRRKKSGRTQKIDDLFDLLVQSGEISSNFRPTPDPALSRLCASSPSPSSSPLHHCTSPLTPSAPDTPPRPPAELTPPNRWQSPNRGVNGRLEDFLESTTGKPLLGVESGSHVTVIDELHSQLLSTPSILDHPASPMDTYELGLSSSHTGLELAESALSSMEWLDLGMGGSTGDGTGHTQSCVFSTDFLDSPDLQLHWDCL